MNVTDKRLRAISALGQSVWLDYIRRDMIATGELGRMIDDDGLRGVTSNPAIFEKVIGEGSAYRAAIAQCKSGVKDSKSLYEQLVIEDIGAAADVFRKVYEQTKRRDGYVSLEVSPDLAYDTAATIAEARRLWRSVARDNLMIKVPATTEGIEAIKTLTGEGVSVNATLLFGEDAYVRVADAYIAGLETLAKNGGDLTATASVASFFISRIDSAVDALIETRLSHADTESRRAGLRGLLGKVAIANAKLVYRRYRKLFSGPRWEALAAQGAQTQRLLWASTGTKNPNYRDVVYVEDLIGPDTVTTLPPATLDAFRDHGRPRASLDEDLESASRVMATLPQVGISMSDVSEQLLVDGVRLFRDAFDKLLTTLEARRSESG